MRRNRSGRYRFIEVHSSLTSRNTEHPLPIAVEVSWYLSEMNVGNDITIQALTRHKRACPQPKGHPESDKVYTSWFETRSASSLSHPPDFNCRADLELGDLYVHHTPDQIQIWLWSLGGGPLHIVQWKSITVGYRRSEDGRRLRITQNRIQPSWVREEWYAKVAQQDALRAGTSRLALSFELCS